MYHQILVRIMDRGTDVTEQFESFGNRELAVFAVMIYGLAGDVFHYHIRQAIRCGAAIEQAGNVRMIKSGENLSLVSKAAEDFRVAEFVMNDFDGNTFLVLVVSADGKVHITHASVTQLLNHLVGPDKAPFHRRPFFLDDSFDSSITNNVVDALRRLVIGQNQRFGFAAQTRISVTGVIEKSRPTVGR